MRALLRSTWYVQIQRMCEIFIVQQVQIGKFWIILNFKLVFLKFQNFSILFRNFENFKV